MAEITTIEHNADLALLDREMRGYVDGVLAADQKSGEAMLEKSRYLLAARNAAKTKERGTWGAFLAAIGVDERAAQRHLLIAERAEYDHRYADGVRSGWLSFSVAALVARADGDLLNKMITAPEPPTRRMVEAELRPTPVSASEHQIFYAAHAPAFEAAGIPLRLVSSGLQLYDGEDDAYYATNPTDALDALRRLQRAQGVAVEGVATKPVSYYGGYSNSAPAQAAQAEVLPVLVPRQRQPLPTVGAAWKIYYLDDRDDVVVLEHRATSYRETGPDAETLFWRIPVLEFYLAELGGGWYVSLDVMNERYSATHQHYDRIEAESMPRLSYLAYRARTIEADLPDVEDALIEALYLHSSPIVWNDRLQQWMEEGEPIEFDEAELRFEVGLPAPAPAPALPPPPTQAEIVEQVDRTADRVFDIASDLCDAAMMKQYPAMISAAFDLMEALFHADLREALEFAEVWANDLDNDVLARRLRPFLNPDPTHQPPELPDGLAERAKAVGMEVGGAVWSEYLGVWQWRTLETNDRGGVTRSSTTLENLRIHVEYKEKEQR